MKVWHITKTLYGGAGTYAKRLSDALRVEGVDSCVLCEDPVDMEGAQELSPVPARVSGFASRVIRSLSHRLSSRAYQSFLAPERSKSKQMPQAGDIIHLHSLTGWIGVRGLNALIPEGSRVFWTSHDLWPLTGGCIVYSECDGYRNDCGSCPALNSGVKSWAKFELRIKENFIRQQQVTPVANSRWMASHIEESRIYQGGSEVPVIPPIVDPVYFSDEIDNIRERLQIPSDKRVIALGAREVTDRHKGIPEFLEALAKRDELAQQCVILLFGEGELDLPENLDAKVLGRLNSAEELAQVYTSSDLFVSPSAMETFGMVLTEAQACGTPVAAFDVGGVRDAVSEECADFLVPNGDFESLLNAINNVFEKCSKGDGAWRVNRDWVRERFEASVIAAKQMEVYSRYAAVPGS